MMPFTYKGAILNLILITVICQFACSHLIAGHAIQRMVGNQKFQNSFTRLYYCIRFSLDFHAIGYRGNTGSRQQTIALYFYHAQATCPQTTEVRIIT
jgi:hypothetical protein